MTALTRRSLLAGAAAATVCGTVAAPVATPHPDAELIATYAEFVAIDREYNFACLQGETPEEKEALYQHWRDLFDQLTDFKAKTMKGLAVLALAALRDCDTLCNSAPALDAWDGYSKPLGLDDADTVEVLLWNLSAC